MIAARRSVRRALNATLGVAATDRALLIYRDMRSKVAYAASRHGRRSARELRELRDRYRGQRCIIIGNGPSLGRMDLSGLRGEYTFGLNRIYLLFDELGFATTFLVSVNEHVIEQCADEILAAPSRKFLSWHAARHLRSLDDVTLLRTTRGPGFSTDPASGLWEGTTVTYVALQLAYHMGFTTAVLIGVDHSFSTQGPAHQLVTSRGDDPDHFRSDYFGAGFRWQLPDLAQSEVAYRLAREQYESAGRRILDATVGGKLTVFPKADLDQILADRSQPAPG